MTVDGCVDTSDCVEVMLGNIRNAFETRITVYPNPTNGDLRVQLTQAATDSVIIRNMMVQIVSADQFVNAGLIMVTIDTTPGN